MPDDLGDQLVTVRRNNEIAMATVQSLTSLQGLLNERWRDTHTQQADRALTVLAGELSALLPEARTVLAELGDVSDAASAISADRTDQWRQALALSARYDALRSAQQTFVSAALFPPDQARVTIRVTPEARGLVLDYGHVREPEQYYAELGTGAANRRDDQLSETRVVEGRVVFSSHTDRPARARPWASGDTIIDMRFVTRDDVIAWVPTVRQLTGARDEHQARMLDEARAEAERLPGDEPQPFLRTGRTMPPPPAALLDRLAREEMGEPV